MYIVWKANWRMITYLRDGEDSWLGVWRRALCVETTVTSPSAQNNLPARAGLSVVCLHWELFQTAHARANVHGTLHTSRKYVYLTLKAQTWKISHGDEMSVLLSVCLSLALLHANKHTQTPVLTHTPFPDPVHTAGLATLCECSDSKSSADQECVCVSDCLHVSVCMWIPASTYANMFVSSCFYLCVCVWESMSDCPVRERMMEH